MSDTTAIEWTDHTLNPWWGCARVSPACRFCYADDQAKRYGHQVWRRHGPRRMLSDANWQRPVKWNRDAKAAGVPAKVFCASMADVFEDHPDVAESRERLWGVIEATPWLRWQLLTKRPENVARMAPWGNEWPSWVWLGTSVENQRYADERIPLLLQNRARVHFLSCEPLLGPVDLRTWLFPESKGCNCAYPDAGGYSVHEPYCGLEPPLIDWIICGGESGSKARPMSPTWARSLRDQCQAAGVPFFFKQRGEWTWESRLGDPEPQVYVSAADGRVVGEQTALDDGGSWTGVRRVGKKLAGRELDGQTWDEFPVAAGAAA